MEAMRDAREVLGEFYSEENRTILEWHHQMFCDHSPEVRLNAIKELGSIAKREMGRTNSSPWKEYDFDKSYQLGCVLRPEIGAICALHSTIEREIKHNREIACRILADLTGTTPTASEIIYKISLAPGCAEDLCEEIIALADHHCVYSIHIIAKLLHYENYYVRECARYNLTRLINETRALLINDRWVRSEAARAVSKMGCNQFSNQVNEALESDFWGIRLTALTCLMYSTASKWEGLIIARLKDEHPSVRGRAAFMLAQYGTESAIAAMQKTCAEWEPDAYKYIKSVITEREKLNKLFGKIESRDVNENDMYEHYGHVVSIARSGIAPELKKAAIAELKKIWFYTGDFVKPTKDSAIIQNVFSDNNRFVPPLNLDKYDFILDPLKALIDASKDESAEVKLEAIKAMMLCNSPRCIEPLMNALGDESGTVRTTVAKYLSSILVTYAELDAQAKECGRAYEIIGKHIPIDELVDRHTCNPVVNAPTDNRTTAYDNLPKTVEILCVNTALDDPEFLDKYEAFRNMTALIFKNPNKDTLTKALKKTH